MFSSSCLLPGYVLLYHVRYCRLSRNEPTENQDVPVELTGITSTLAIHTNRMSGTNHKKHQHSHYRIEPSRKNNFMHSVLYLIDKFTFSVQIWRDIQKIAPGYRPFKWIILQLFHGKLNTNGSGGGLYLPTYLRYKETKSWEKRMNSLTTAAGEWIPRNGTMSTCSQYSTADPTTAPATSPPIVMMVAFPAKSY